MAIISARHKCPELRQGVDDAGEHGSALIGKNSRRRCVSVGRGWRQCAGRADPGSTGPRRESG